jgi:hypothetical protein
MLIATATTVAMGIDDVSNARFYCVSAGLVPLHSPKLGLNYLKMKRMHYVINSN